MFGTLRTDHQKQMEWEGIGRQFTKKKGIPAMENYGLKKIL